MGYETSQPKSTPIVLIVVLVVVGLFVVLVVGAVLLSAFFWITVRVAPPELPAPPPDLARALAPEEMSSPQSVEDREMVVVLPEAADPQPLTVQPEEIVINIDAHGIVTVDGKIMDDDALMKLLRAASQDNPGRQRVVIRADKECMFDRVANTMNLCNKAGIRDVTATVLPPPSDATK